MRGPWSEALEPPGRTSTSSSHLSLNSWPEPHGKRHVRWAAGHVPTPGNPSPHTLMSGVLMPLQNWLPRPRRSHVLPVVGAGISPSAKALPCLQPWRAPRPPGGPPSCSQEPAGPRPSASRSPGAGGQPLGTQDPRSATAPRPVRSASAATHLLWRARPEAVPSMRSLPHLGPAPPCPRAPTAPPCGQGGRPCPPGSHVGATRSCYWLPAPLSMGLWAHWVGFRPLPAKPHCENRGTACSRGAKGEGSAFQRPRRDPGWRSRQLRRGAHSLG